MDANRIRFDACRLCLCEVDQQLGYSAIADPGFQTMLMHLFRFPVPPLYTFANQTYLLPGLVCSQCATNVRNFYFFSKQAETNQKVLQSHSLNHNGNSSVVAIDKCIKAEPGLECNVSKASSSDGSTNPHSMQTREEDPLRLFNSVNDCSNNALQMEPIINSSSCFGKDEVVEYLEKTDRPLSSVTVTLGELENTIGYPPVALSPSHDSFNFSPIATEHEITTFNKDLSDKEYFNKVLYWLNSHVTAEYYESRLLEAQDLLFQKEFLMSCSWTGRSSQVTPYKITFKYFSNVLNLFKTIGSTPHMTVSEKQVNIYFMNKLKRAKVRLFSKSRCLQRKKDVKDVCVAYGVKEEEY